MKRKKQTWRQRLEAWLNNRNEHHRICRKCHQPIKKHHRWHQLQVGWFSITYTVEHNDCKNPTMETPRERSMRMGPELPFNETTQDEQTWKSEEQELAPDWPSEIDRQE